MKKEEQKNKRFKLTCRDVGVDCDVEFIGKDKEAVMKMASEHAASEHNLPVIPPHIEKKCLNSVKEIEIEENE